jgi:hypothetical protein
VAGDVVCALLSIAPLVTRGRVRYCSAPLPDTAPRRCAAAILRGLYAAAFKRHRGRMAHQRELLVVTAAACALLACAGFWLYPSTVDGGVHSRLFASDKRRPLSLPPLSAPAWLLFLLLLLCLVCLVQVRSLKQAQVKAAQSLLDDVRGVTQQVARLEKTVIHLRALRGAGAA